MEVSAMTLRGAESRYLPSSSESTGNILWGIEPFDRWLGRDRTETAVTSEPVPQVVGMQTTGRASVTAEESYRYSGPWSF